MRARRPPTEPQVINVYTLPTASRFESHQRSLPRPLRPISFPSGCFSRSRHRCRLRLWPVCRVTATQYLSAGFVCFKDKYDGRTRRPASEASCPFYGNLLFINYVASAIPNRCDTTEPCGKDNTHANTALCVSVMLTAGFPL